MPSCRPNSSAQRTPTGRLAPIGRGRWPFPGSLPVLLTLVFGLACSSSPRGPLEIEIPPWHWGSTIDDPVAPAAPGSASASPPDPRRIVEIEVVVPGWLTPGQRDLATASALHADGGRSDVSNQATWSSANPEVVATGVGAPPGIAAKTPGVTTIAATFGGVTSRGAGILVATAQTLPSVKPGAGASVPEPSSVGQPSPPNEATAIARWNVVPYQSFDAGFLAGVVAFHEAGIDRVEFSVDRGPWVAVDHMSFNPRTRTWEYFVRIDPTSYATARAVELRAVAIPRRGAPRRLDPLPLFAVPTGSPTGLHCFVSPQGSNSGDGTRERPLRTLAAAALWIERSAAQRTADGGVIYLEAGEHDLGAVSDRDPRTARTYLTIEPAPGAPMGSVALTSASSRGLATKLLRLRNLVIRTAIPTDESLEDYLWLDGCSLEGAGRWDQVSSVGFINGPKWTGTFVTNCTVGRNSDGLVNVTFAREVRVRDIGRDAFKNVDVIINCSVDGIDKGVTSWHPDVVQYTRPMENAIVYGLRGSNLAAQGLFAKFSSGELRDVAWVNVEIESRAYLSQVKVACDHLLVWQCTLRQQPLSFELPVDPPSRNISVDSCTFHQLWGNLPPHAITNCIVGTPRADGTPPQRNGSLPPIDGRGHFVGAP